MNRTVLLTLFLNLFGLAGGVLAGESPPVESLPALVATALQNNPELKSSAARWQMYRHRVKQASSREDPMLMLKLQNMVNRAPLSFNRDATTAKVIGLSQQIPFPGKLELKEEIAALEAESYRWQIEERKLELARMVKETYYQLYAVDRALVVVSRNLAVVEDLLKIAETRYAVGQGAQADILRGGVEKSKMLEMQLTLQQQRRSLAANMDYLLARPDGTPFGTIADFELPPLQRTSAELRELAERSRPGLKSLASQAGKGRAAGRLAARESYPDFTVSLEYMQRVAAMSDPGYDMYSLSVSFNLPVQKERREAMRAESAAESTMALEESSALRSSIRYTIADNLAVLERRRSLVELYRTGLIPQAEQSLESALIGYRVGKVDFLTLLDGRSTLFTYERELSESKAEYMLALARLEAAVGEDLVSAPQAPPPAAEKPELVPTAVVPPAGEHSQHQ